MQVVRNTVGGVKFFYFIVAAFDHAAGMSIRLSRTARKDKENQDKIKEFLNM